MLAAGAKGGALKRMPWTIPELVKNSPCKSSDGILYTGRKVLFISRNFNPQPFFSCVLATLVYLLQVDTWFSVDRLTGNKKGAMSVGGCSAFDECPNARYEHKRTSFFTFFYLHDPRNHSIRNSGNHLESFGVKDTVRCEHVTTNQGQNA